MEQAEELPGVPDAFQRLWTPHRMVYIRGENRPESDTAPACPFCRIPSRTDADGLIVHRGEHAYVVLNLYPYSPGHLLVCPYRHIADYTDLTADEGRELTELTQDAMRALRSASSPDGFNLGVNQGSIAGAGIAAHLHQHVVPRWAGDANFLPVVGQTKALPQLLGDTRELVSQAWRELRTTTSPD
ncbi:ATP adenylyltransferase [Microlunatus parietis]|uniref:ATP adenylyltransferase n=1 Tax=Microlunatus parietis TaxID=682979 RepID=A0A7Y9I2K5_9ACTN|nr:ATP adenylyltransferase [Microlunatus parietis]